MREVAMTEVSIREFSYNPSAMFARVEQGEVVEVTRRGKVIAVCTPPPGPRSRVEELIAQGVLHPAKGNLKAGDWDKFPHIDVPDDVDPLAILLEMREEER
jgi:antitoxin (DNA-binding transcriptional repressor) of toxin-antitoxin stability system